MMPEFKKLHQVICRTESREDERPLKFRLGDDWIEVDQVIAAWLERGPAEGAATYRVFDVQCGQDVYRLRTPVYGWVWEYCKKSFSA